MSSDYDEENEDSDDVVSVDPYADDSDDAVSVDPYADDSDDSDDMNSDTDSEEEEEGNPHALWIRRVFGDALKDFKVTCKGGYKSIEDIIGSCVHEAVVKNDFPHSAFGFLRCVHRSVKGSSREDLEKVLSCLPQKEDEDDGAASKTTSASVFVTKRGKCAVCSLGDDDEEEDVLCPRGAEKDSVFFCRDCLQSNFAEVVRSQGTACVFWKFNKSDRVLLPNEVKDLMETFDPKSYRRYVERVVDAFVVADGRSSLQWCPNKRCSYLYWRNLDFYEDDDDVNTLPATCGGCRTQWCFRCRRDVDKVVDLHYPTSCAYTQCWVKSVQSTKGFDAFIAKAKEAGLVKNCPNAKCAQPILKKTGPGCLHMKCVMCKIDFCWMCLQTPFHTGEAGGFYACKKTQARIKSLTVGTKETLKTNVHIEFGKERRAAIMVERERIAKEHFDRADESLAVVRTKLMDFVQCAQSKLLEANINVGASSILTDCAKDVAIAARFLKWLPVHVFFEYELDREDGRLNELSAIQMRMGSLTELVKRMYAEIFHVPYRAIRCVDGGSEKGKQQWQCYRDSLSNMRNRLKQMREKMHKAILDSFPDLIRMRHNERKKTDGRKERHREYRLARTWLKEQGLDEWGNPTSNSTSTGATKTSSDGNAAFTSISASSEAKLRSGDSVFDFISYQNDKEREVLGFEESEEEENPDATRKSTTYPKWLANLLFLELLFAHRPWIHFGSIMMEDEAPEGRAGKLVVTPSMSRTAKIREEKEDAQRKKTPWWWWKPPGVNGFVPLTSEVKNTLEKVYEKWQLDHDELNLDRLFRRLVKTSTVPYNGETTADGEGMQRKRPKRTTIVPTVGSRRGETKLCKFYRNGSTGCRKGSNCPYVHDTSQSSTSSGGAAARATAAAVDNSAESLNTHVQTLSFGFDVKAKVRINFDKVKIDSISGLLVRTYNVRCIDPTSVARTIQMERREEREEAWMCQCTNWIPNSFAKCTICDSDRQGGAQRRPKLRGISSLLRFVGSS